MNDEHNRHDPFAAPEPERFDPTPQRLEPTAEPFEPHSPVPPARDAEVPVSAYSYAPVHETAHDAPAMPVDPLIGPDPLLAGEHGAVAAHDPRLALDGT